MIELTDIEKKIILICKLQKKEEFPFIDNWARTLAPISIELWGWDALEDGNYNDYLGGIFRFLLKLYQKIEYNKSGDPNYYLNQIFSASFSKSISRNEDEPVERAICELCSLIQITRVLNDDKSKRFDLE